MRIVICIHSLGNGGAERVAALWAQGFLTRGNDVHLITTMGDEHIEYISKEDNYKLPHDITVHDISVSGEKLLRYFRRLLHLRKLLKSIHPDVAIAVLMPWDIWLLLSTVGMKIPLINTEHDSFERPFSAPMSKRQWIHKFILNHAFRAVTVLNEADRAVAGTHFSNMYVLPNPLAFTPLSVVPPKDKVVFAAGRLDSWHYKGFDVLIKAWGKIAKQHYDWKLCIAGAGSKADIAYLSQIANVSGATESVCFLGFRKDIVSDFRNASIFVLSSRYEGFGLVLIEAMSQGCACIACDYKGRQKEIITNGSEGLLCAPDDVEELAKGIEKLLSDDVYRTILQKSALKRAKNYTLDKIIDRWYYLFEQLSIV